MPQLFLDCDGVLADFDRYARAYFHGRDPRMVEAQIGSDRFWQELRDHGSFYRNLPLMSDARALLQQVGHLCPKILTGCPRDGWAEEQKIAWANEHFPGVPVITCKSARKCDYAQQGDVLIDDWPKYRHKWVEAGGIFISHYDAQTSLDTLWAYYPEWKNNDFQKNQA